VRSKAGKQTGWKKPKPPSWPTHREPPIAIADRLSSATGGRKITAMAFTRHSRYTPQAVLTANIEEADYSALVTADGKMLVSRASPCVTINETF